MKQTAGPEVLNRRRKFPKVTQNTVNLSHQSITPAQNILPVAQWTAYYVPKMTIRSDYLQLPSTTMHLHFSALIFMQQLDASHMANIFRRPVAPPAIKPRSSA